MPSASWRILPAIGFRRYQKRKEHVALIDGAEGLRSLLRLQGRRCLQQQEVLEAESSKCPTPYLPHPLRPAPAPESLKISTPLVCPRSLVSPPPRCLRPALRVTARPARRNITARYERRAVTRSALGGSCSRHVVALRLLAPP